MSCCALHKRESVRLAASIFCSLTYCCGFMFLWKLTFQFIYSWKNLFFWLMPNFDVSMLNFYVRLKLSHLVWLVVKFQKDWMLNWEWVKNKRIQLLNHVTQEKEWKHWQSQHTEILFKQAKFSQYLLQVFKLQPPNSDQASDWSDLWFL